MKKFRKVVSFVTALAATCSMLVMPATYVSAKAVSDGFKDDFESHEIQSDIISFRAISSALSGQGRMIPEEGYGWAERYDTSNGEYGEGCGFYPVIDPDGNGNIGHLYNYSTTQFYGISSKNVTDANTKNIVASGRFLIPDVEQISEFSFSLTPVSHYNSKNLWGHAPLITVKKNGEVYKSIQDDTAVWGAVSEKLEDTVIESYVWYNVIFMVNNSVDRSYKGRVFTDDGSVDITIEGYLAQLSCAWDTNASGVCLGLVLGKAGEDTENQVLVDDTAIYTTDYGFTNPIPTTEAKITAAATDVTTISIDTDAVYSLYDINKNTISIVDSDGSMVEVSGVTNEGNSLMVKLAEELSPDKEYIVKISGKDVFLNTFANSNAFVYVAPDLSKKTVFEGYNDDFEGYEEQTDITSFSAISAGLAGQGRMNPVGDYKWAERYDTSLSEYGEGYGFYSIDNPEGDGKNGYLYNYATTQFYGVSSKQVSHANERSIVSTGRFYIPDTEQISDFAFGLVPKSHYGATNYWPHCPLITVRKNGEVYKSIQDDTAVWGAGIEKLEDAVIESGIWYNVVFMTENSISRKYKGRLFTDDGSVNIAVEGYLPQLTCSWDTKASIIGLGLKVGKSSSADNANHIFVDDTAIYTTDYHFAHAIPEEAGSSEVIIKNANTLSVLADNPVSASDITTGMVKVTDKSGKNIEVTDVVNAENSLDIILASGMAQGNEYTVEISGKDIFLNELNVKDTVAYEGIKVEDVAFTKDGQSVNVVSSGIIECEVAINNPTNTEYKGVLVIALYKGTSLVKASISEIVPITNGKTTLKDSIECEITGDASEYRLRAFVWDAEDMITPIVEPVDMMK